jgi:lipopolysaccharide transport system permease protein
MKTIIDSKSVNKLHLSEIIRYKDLLWNLSMRDVLIRYKQTFVGVSWAVIRPLVNIVIFGFLAQFIEQSPNLTLKFMQVSAGVIIWGLISGSINDSSNSVISNANILTKVYFPKLIIPVSSLTVCLIDFLISFVILFILRFVFMGLPGPEIFLLPVFVAYALLFSFSVGLYFSALNVKFRDVKFVIPFLLQIGFYVVPVFLSTSFYLQKLPEVLKPLFLINPLVTVVEGFKHAFLGDAFSVPLQYAAGGFLITLVLLVFSLRYFVKFEKTFADYI